MGNFATFSHVNSRSTRGNGEKGLEENEGTPNLTQRSHLTIPSRFDAAGGWCSRHVVFPTLCPPSFALLSPFLIHTYTHTSQRIPLSLSFLLPLRLSLHPSVDQGTFHSAQGVIPPRGRSLSTLVINTNCSIQTFKMCLTFLWHVIPSPPLFPFLYVFLSFSISLSSYASLYIMQQRNGFPPFFPLSVVW